MFNDITYADFSFYKTILESDNHNYITYLVVICSWLILEPISALIANFGTWRTKHSKISPFGK